MVLGKSKLVQRSPEALVVLSSEGTFFALGPLRDKLDSLPGILFLGVLVLFMAPGLLVSHWFLGEHFPGAASLPAAFVISTGLFGLSGIPMLFLHTGLDVYLWIAGAIHAVFLVMALGIVLAGRTMESGDDTDPDHGWL
jgi:hypothetical protein